MLLQSHEHVHVLKRKYSHPHKQRCSSVLSRTLCFIFMSCGSTICTFCISIERLRPILKIDLLFCGATSAAMKRILVMSKSSSAGGLKILGFISRLQRSKAEEQIGQTEWSPSHLHQKDKL